MSIKSRVVTVITTVALSGVAAVVPLAAVADHSTAHTIEQLSAQIAALQAQLAALAGAPAAPAAGAKCSFTKNLFQGVRGDDVKCLQETLISQGHLATGNNTGFFGPLTKAAVAKWQAAAGVSPAVGYFGPISRAKYDAVVAAAPAAPAAPGAPAVPVAVGSGLTVTAPVEQPAATLAVGSAARVPFTKAVFTASADGDVTVKSITVERKGLASDVNFDGVLLLDEDGTQIGDSKTLTSEHKVVLSTSFVVKAGTSKTMTIATNMAASGTMEAGQVARFALIAVDAGTSKVNASLPIEGNGMTTNTTLTIGSVTMSIGSLDPGAANTKNVGTKGYYLASVKGASGSAEDVIFESIRFNQAGSAASGDLENVLVKSGDKEYPASVSSDGKYYEAKFADGIKVAKGANTEFSIKADLVNGSARTVDMNLLKKADVVVKGVTFGYHIVVGGGSAGSASAGAFSSNQEPFFNAYAATIDKGSVLVSSSNKVAAGNVPVDVGDTTFGGFLIDVKGEAVQVSSFRLNYSFSGTGTSTDLVGMKLVDEKGSILAGPKDGVAAGITFTDTWTLPVGENHVFVKGKADTTFVSNDTVQVSVDPDDSITAKGQVTGLSITPTPTSNVAANTQTVKAGALAMSVSPTPFGQNVVRGVNGFLFATLTLDAGSSGEDVRMTSIKIRDTISANGVADEINSCQIFDGATALNTGSDVLNPADDASGTTEDNTISLTSNLVVPKGTVKKVDLKCNISPAATSNSTHQIGLNDTSAHNVVGAKTSQAITETVTTGVGSLMTVKIAGSYTVVKDASAPTTAMVLSGKTDAPFNVLKFHATDEAVKITDVTLTFSTTTASTSDFAKATLWDGATKLGEAVWVADARNATSTLTGDFTIPKDGDKLMTVKADLASISVIASTTAGRLLAVDYNGISSTTGIGQSSGQRLGSSSGSNSDGASMQIMKTMPTLEKVAVPSTSVPQTDAILYRFKVTADAAGPVALYKLTFTVSSSTVNATSSNFRVFGYTDSSFSVSAYSQNPTHQDNVDCISLSNLDSDTGGCAAVTVSSGTASATDVVWFFGPVANTSSTTEAVTVPAGGTRYFELRGDITLVGSGTGNSFQVSLLGDAARTVFNAGTGPNALGTGGFHDGGRGRLGTAGEAASQSANNDFIWSPMSTSTSLTGATSTTDWTNGFLVPGLPTTNMSGNLFTN